MLFKYFFIIGLFLSSYASASDSDLSVLRDVAFETIIRQNTNELAVERQHKTRTLLSQGIQGWWSALFQEDNVDRSWITFRFEREAATTSCALHIREEPETAEVFLSLIECNGPEPTTLLNGNLKAQLTCALIKEELQGSPEVLKIGNCR